jgi:hypothetical protein
VRDRRSSDSDSPIVEAEILTRIPVLQTPGASQLGVLRGQNRARLTTRGIEEQVGHPRADEALLRVLLTSTTVEENETSRTRVASDGSRDEGDELAIRHPDRITIAGRSQFLRTTTEGGDGDLGESGRALGSRLRRRREGHELDSRTERLPSVPALRLTTAGIADDEIRTPLLTHRTGLRQLEPAIHEPVDELLTGTTTETVHPAGGHTDATIERLTLRELTLTILEEGGGRHELTGEGEEILANVLQESLGACRDAEVREPDHPCDETEGLEGGTYELDEDDVLDDSHRLDDRRPTQILEHRGREVQIQLQRRHRSARSEDRDASH